MLSKNHHISIYPKQKYNDQFRIEWDTLYPSIYSWKDICEKTLYEIANTHNKLFLALSGGVDSEYIAKLLLKYDISFTPIILYWTEGYNKHDIYYAEQFCQTNKLTPIYINISWDRYKEEIKRRADIIKPSLPFSIVHTFLSDAAEHLGGYLLSGSKNVKYRFDNDSIIFEEHEREYIIDIWTHCKHPTFYQWSPTIISTWIQYIVPNRLMAKHKWYMYDVMPRPKYDGYEHLRELFKPLSLYCEDNFGKHETCNLNYICRSFYENNNFILNSNS